MTLQQKPQKPSGSRERSLDEVKAEFLRRAGRLNPFEDIHRAAERIKSIAKRTPVMTSHAFDEKAGVNAFFKCAYQARCRMCS